MTTATPGQRLAKNDVIFYQNVVISRCCFAEDGKEMYKDL